MAAKDYRQLLEDLRAGKIEEFVVTPAEFMDFQPIYHDYEYRTQIVLYLPLTIATMVILKALVANCQCPTKP